MKKTHTGRTVGNENADDHGAEHDAEGDGLEAQRRHVAPGGKRPILQLQDTKRNRRDRLDERSLD